MASPVWIFSKVCWFSSFILFTQGTTLPNGRPDVNKRTFQSASIDGVGGNMEDLELCIDRVYLPVLNSHCARNR